MGEMYYRLGNCPGIINVAGRHKCGRTYNFQMSILPLGSPQATCVPSGDQVTQVMLWRLLIESKNWPLPDLHTLRVLSTLAEAMSDPSGCDHARSNTGPLCWLAVKRS